MDNIEGGRKRLTTLKKEKEKEKVKVEDDQSWHNHMLPC
jgi:hypothetical protein